MEIHTDPGSGVQNARNWPTIDEPIPRMKGSSPSLSKGESENKNTIKSELPSNLVPKVPPSYSAAVGVDTVDQALLVDEKDGERIGIIPEDLLMDDKPLWKDLIVGKFPSKAPKLKDIFFTVNKIWTLGDRNIKIEVYQVSDTLIKFRITDKNTRERVLRRGMWSILGLPMILSKWAPIEELEELEVRVVPIWVTLKKVPRSLFHWKGLRYIAKVVGKPIRLHPETIQCTKFDEARVLVEVDLNAPRPSTHKFRSASKGMFSVDYEYPWVPQRCNTCYKWGHNSTACNTMKIIEKRNDGRDELRKETNLEPGRSPVVQITSGNSPSSLRGRDIGEDSSNATQGDFTGSGLNVLINTTHQHLDDSINEEQSHELYSKSLGKKVVTVDDAKEELRLVKEGLRQVRSSAESLERTKKFGEISGEKDREEEKMVENQSHSPMFNSTIKELNGGNIKQLVRDIDPEEGWSTVPVGKGCKQMEVKTGEGKTVSPGSNTRYDILADSLEEMEMMVENEENNLEEEEGEHMEDEYNIQEDKALNGRVKAKNKKKEDKQPVVRGRGRGRKQKS